MADPEIHIRTWVRGTADEAHQGLLGYLSVFIDRVVIDGITLRRTVEGRLRLSFPERRDSKGRRHPVVRPIDNAARQAIEREILGQLGQREDARTEVQP